MIPNFRFTAEFKRRKFRALCTVISSGPYERYVGVIRHTPNYFPSVLQSAEWEVYDVFDPE